MTRLWLGALLVVGGCELIADIPNATVGTRDGGSDAGPDAKPECLVPDECPTAEKPACDPLIHVCRACVDDGECPSDVCLPDGTCADSARFVYAAAGGIGTACTLMTPCALDTAVGKLTPTTDIVKMAPGTYVRGVTLSVAQSGFLAGAGSTFHVIADASPIIGISVTGGAHLAVLGLALALDANADGVHCIGGMLELHRVHSTGGAQGIYADGCGLTMRSTRIESAHYYAAYAHAAPVDIANTYIVNNDTQPGYTLPALVLEDVPSGSIVHSTFAANTPGGVAGAIGCTNSANVAIRNIIAANNTAPGIGAGCTVSSSVVDTGYVDGTANMQLDPGFVDPTARNYHLSATSPAKETGDPAVTLATDADGEPRPQPAATSPDPGADEIP
ncbi:MAG TPA: hypothetical protein VGM90_18890 [Kofleriaceae bacterium]